MSGARKKVRHWTVKIWMSLHFNIEYVVVRSKRRILRLLSMTE